MIGVDLGPQEAIWVRLCGIWPTRPSVKGWGTWPIPESRRVVVDVPSGILVVIERIESFGMPVGREVFQTVLAGGRVCEALLRAGCRIAWIPRRAVKLALCQSMRATDATIRQAILDRYGPGRAVAVGTKAAPGPLYGITRHAWSALAVGLTWWDNPSMASMEETTGDTR